MIATPPSIAWWSGTIATFQATPDETILARLALRLVETHHLNRETQIQSWRAQIPILRAALVNLRPDYRLLLEYPLLRLGRRLDVVIVTEDAVMILEFKIARHFDHAARMQTEDYALDLRDFHAGCRHHPIVAIHVASEGEPAPQAFPLIWDVANPVFQASRDSLPRLLETIMTAVPHGRIDIEAWERAAYRPVPTIIEAATMLYTKHGVADIAAARADLGNLNRTTDVILEAIHDAKAGRHHVIVFVTGIPGAGKTLCGLNAVFRAETDAAFLTGTLPMVHVLREALARDAAGATDKSKRQARHETESKVQSVVAFMRHYTTTAEAPHERIIVFDEAQRAWDAAYGARKFKLENSEAALFLDIMRRHQDYAVIIALIGSGQEINTGEAGLAEWGRALGPRPDWQIRAAPGVLEAAEPRQRLFATPPANISIDPGLHLEISVRSIRATSGPHWVDAVLRGATAEARHLAVAGIPVFITRSLAAMRAGLRERMRGHRRAGLVCSTGAARLVADGIWPDFPHLDDAAVANWFLNRWPDDPRSSEALEIPATQFAIQGLELDHVGLCWGGDMVWTGMGAKAWTYRRFAGKKWQYPKSRDGKDFIRNTYRVLLTRARYDTIIWIPPGDPSDPTREPALFDQTASYLLTCGASPLAEAWTLPEAAQPAAVLV